MKNECHNCGGDGIVPDPKRGWRIWRTITCSVCGGDGIAKPPGWPNKLDMQRLRPSPPPPPPPPMVSNVRSPNCHR